MSKAKMEAARELIREKRYAEARVILNTIDHPTATEWLEKLDQIAPTKKVEATGSGATVLIVVLAGMIVIVGLALFVYTQRERIPAVAALFATQTLIPSPTPTATSTPTATNVPTGTPAPTGTPTPTRTATRRPTSTRQPTLEATATEEVADLGKWVVDTKVSQLDSAKSATITLDSNDKVQGSITSGQPSLIVRCKENLTEVYVYAGVQLDDDYKSKTTHVRYKFDSEAIRNEDSGVSTSGSAFFFNNPRTILKALRTHDKLIVGFKPFRTSDAEAVFDIRGLEAAIATVDQDCGW